MIDRKLKTKYITWYPKTLFGRGSFEDYEDRVSRDRCLRERKAYEELMSKSPTPYDRLQMYLIEQFYGEPRTRMGLWRTDRENYGDWLHIPVILSLSGETDGTIFRSIYTEILTKRKFCYNRWGDVDERNLYWVNGNSVRKMLHGSELCGYRFPGPSVYSSFNPIYSLGYVDDGITEQDIDLVKRCESIFKPKYEGLFRLLDAIDAELNKQERQKLGYDQYLEDKINRLF